MQLRPFPTDPRLTGMVLAYRNAEMIADRVFPRVPVPKKEFRWLKFDRAQRMTVPETLVGRKSRPNEVDFSAQEEPGLVYDRGLDSVVPNDDIPEAAGTGYDPIAEAAEGTTELIVLDREIRAANKAMNANNFATGSKVVVTEKWDDPDSKPLVQIRDQLDSMFVRPNVLVMPVPVWNKLSQHPTVVSALTISGTVNGFATREAVARLLEIDEILIGRAWVNNARPGQEPVMARAWGGENVLAFYRNPTATPRRGITFGFTAQWGGRVAGQIPDPMVGLRGGVRVRVGESVNELIVAQDVAFLWQDTLST